MERFTASTGPDTEFVIFPVLCSVCSCVSPPGIGDFSNLTSTDTQETSHKFKWLCGDCKTNISALPDKVKMELMGNVSQNTSTDYCENCVAIRSGLASTTPSNGSEGSQSSSISRFEEKLSKINKLLAKKRKVLFFTLGSTVVLGLSSLLINLSNKL